MVLECFLERGGAMGRPIKCRRVCHFPKTVAFVPVGKEEEEPIVLTVDEFETIRLIDQEGLSQEACGIQLGVARTTVQSIYEKARKKIAEALVLGLPLRVAGGDYQLCNGNTQYCYRGDCFKKQIQIQFTRKKGEHTMRIAVTYENGNIFQHFGRTSQFKVYDVENGEIIHAEVLDTNGQGHGALAGVLAAANADVLICGGIGGGAQAALANAGIQLYGGVSGDADEAVKALIAGNLSFNSDVHCDHHEHGEHGHSCGEHGCGSGHCQNH